MADKHLNEAGKNTRFGAPNGNSNKRGGRKKKLKNILKMEGYAAADIRRVTLALASMSERELNDVVKDKENPSIFRIAGGAFLQALKKRGADLRLVKELVELAAPNGKSEDAAGPLEIVIKRESPPQ